MFRMKKGPGSDVPESGVTAPTETVIEEPIAKAPPRKAIPIPARPVGTTTFPIDIPRRGADHASGHARIDSTVGTARDKSLIVGKDVRLKGDVLACDKLIIEGETDIVVNDCRLLQIGTTGTFRGTADVTEADVAGLFEGTLVVRERLSVRPSGRIEGTVEYGQIAIEAGGQVVGDLRTLGGHSRLKSSGEGAGDTPSAELASLTTLDQSQAKASAPRAVAEFITTTERS
jgi:cytoskeletal protein CcmA (bactofilin family)